MLFYIRKFIVVVKSYSLTTNDIIIILFIKITF